jgi:hypothetical protein
MRSLGLGLFTIALVFSLRPISDYFREPAHPILASVLIEAPLGAAPEAGRPSLPKAGAVSGSAVHPARAIKPTEALVAPALVAEGDEALVVAIEIELMRLGLYDDVLTSTWSEGVRKAVWKFTGLKDSQPSPRLLAALRTAKPEVSRGAAREQQASNVQARRKLAAAPPDSVESDGYLPPWEAMRGKEAETAQSGGWAQQDETRRARAHRKRDTYARLASARRFGDGGARRHAFANLDFSWPGF